MRKEPHDSGNTPSAEQARFVTFLARDGDHVREAQRLRYRVYREALGAAVESATDELDVDRFDAHCDHLLVRDIDTGEVVGTYRILDHEGARRAGGFYSETEFDLSRVLASDDRLVEVGRACVHPEYRGGGVISLLLSALAALLFERRYERVIGCGSVSAVDPDAAARACAALLAAHLAPEPWRVAPRRPFAHSAPTLGRASFPPLIKAYLRLGAYVCGPPAWDPALLQAAVDAGVEVQPVAIRYPARDGRSDPAAAFVDDMPFVESLRRVTAVAALRCELTFGFAMSTAGATRRELAHASRRFVAATLGLDPLENAMPVTVVSMIRNLPVTRVSDRNVDDHRVETVS